MAKAADTKPLSLRRPTGPGPICRSLTVIVIVSVMLLSPLMTALARATHDSTPFAVIDGTLNVSAGQTVYLDGTFSSDPGGGDLSFIWTLEEQPDDSIATIVDSTDAQASFTADLPGTYRVRLVVNNGLVTSEPVYATVVVTP